MLTMKFGGTSVGDVPRLQEVVSIVKQFLPEQPVVVASAMGGLTNVLLETAHNAVQRKYELVQNAVTSMRDRHLHIAMTMIKDEARRSKLIQEQIASFEELSQLYHGVSMLRELSPRSLDAIASFGELLSCRQIAAVLEENGIASQFVDARTIIRTDNNFGEANIDFVFSNAAINQAVTPLVQKKIVPVVTGFIASTEEDITTTIGRSGSDYTGSVVGAAVNSREIWIWTDVDGVMTADPRYVKGAKVLSEISYREAAEMSYFGAKVIHPKTMVPAIGKKIPIRIKNTFNPTHPGTLISAVPSADRSSAKTVTSIDNLSIIAIEGNGMIGVPGVSARIFSTLARAQVNVMMISQASSEHNVCFIVPHKDSQAGVKALREEFSIDIAKKIIDDVTVKEPVSIVAVVGEGMIGSKGIAGKTFSAVAKAEVNIIAIAQGSSELNISFVVEQADARNAVQAVHDAFHLS
ncbi:MAG: aspartate kinase [Bacteroidota bacterium]|nr:aspartate kinase [Bacteroidota bacterium]